MCKRKLNNVKIESETITCRDYSKYDTTNVMSWKRSWNNLKQILLKVNNKHAQTNTTSKIITKNAKGRNSPWLTREIKSKMNNRDCLMRNVANRNLFQQQRNKVNKLVRKAKNDYHKDKLKDSIYDPKRFWNTLKNFQW